MLLSPWHYEVTAFSLAKALHVFPTIKTERLRCLLKKKKTTHQNCFQTATPKVEGGCFFLMPVGVGKPPTHFKLTAALSMPGSLGAWFESH